MVDSINIPSNLVKIFEVKDTSEPLLRFLTDIAMRLQSAEAKIETLETQVEELNVN